MQHMLSACGGNELLAHLEVGERDCDEGGHDDEDNVDDEQDGPDDVHLRRKTSTEQRRSLCATVSRGPQL